MSRHGQAAPPSFACERGDHAESMRDALAKAEQVSAARGLRLTRLRRRGLELIWARHTPVEASDLRAQLRQEHASAAPPTVDRALGLLVQGGVVHRTAS